MRKLGIAILVIIVLIIIALVVAPSFMNVNNYRGRIDAELQQRLGRPVTLGQMHMKLLPPSIRVDNVAIGEDPRFGAGPFARVQELDVAAKFWPLLHKQLEISSLDLRRPSIELIRNAQGVWNFSSLGQPAEQAPSPAPQPAPAKPQAPPQPQQPQPSQPSAAQKFELDHLRITDGALALTDYQKHQSRAVYDHIDVDLKNFAPDKPFTIIAAAHLPGKGTQVARLSGKVGPLNQSNMIATPVDATVKLSDVQLSGLQKFLNAQALAGTDAVITGTMDLKNDKGNLTSNGVVTLDQARVRGVQVGYPIKANYKVADDLKADVLNIHKADISLGRTPFSITGTVDTKPTPAQLDVQLRASNASLAELAHLAGAFGAGFNPGMKFAGTLNADIHARGASSKPALNGNVSLSNVQASGDGIAEPVKLSDVNLALTPQNITSNDFTAQTGGTSLAVQFALANYTTPNAIANASAKTTNANIAELLNIAKAYGVSAVEGMTGSGTLSLDARASGPIKNTSAMTFNGTGQIRNATVKPPSLTQPVSVRNANLQFTQNSAVVTNLAASVGATNATGMMTMRNFAAPVLQFTLNADKVNVAQLQQLMAPGKPAQKTAFEWNLVPQADAQVARPAPSPQPSILDKMTGTGSIAVAEVIYDQLVLNNVRSNVTLDRGIIRLAPLTAQLYGGQESGNVTLDTRQTPTAVIVSTGMQNVQANSLLSAISPVKNTLYGLFAARGNTGFRATSANEITKTLTGQLSLNLANGRIAGIDLLNELAKIGKFAASGNQTAAQPFTNVAKLTGDFVVNNGLAQTNNLQGAIDGGTLAAQGAVNLVDQSLNMHLTAVLSQAMSQKVGGTGIGGFLNTALANKNGELILPVIVTGTLQHPQVLPDAQKLAEMKLQNVLPTAANPAAGVLGQVLGKKGGQQGGISGILGSIAGQPNQQQQPNQPVANPQQPPPAQAQPQQQQTPQDTVNDVLGQILNKKKKPQQQPQQPPPQPPPASPPPKR